jgi:hypothetical protein
VNHRDSAEQIHTPIAMPTKGANAMKETLNTLFILASMTTEPEANTTTMIFQSIFGFIF